MERGIRKDLFNRLCEAHRAGSCLFARSPSEAHRLRDACKRGALISPAPRVFTLPELWSQLKPAEQERHRLRALSQLHPSWVFASFCAATMYGLEVSYRLYGRVHLACSRESHARSNASFERHIISDDKTNVIDGIRVTSLARTVYDCTCSCSFPAGLAIADSALRMYGVESEDLASQMKTTRSRNKDSWRAAETAMLANPKAADGGESVARAMIIRNGYMVPTLQYEIRDPVDKENRYYADFYWKLPSGNVVGELDGREKYRNPQMTNGRDVVDVLADERLRESRLTGANAKVMRFSYADVLDAKKFCHLMSSFGIPSGFAVPRVALL